MTPDRSGDFPVPKMREVRESQKTDKNGTR